MTALSMTVSMNWKSLLHLFKHLIMKAIFLLPLLALSLQSRAQVALITNTNIQIFGSLESKPLAWASDAVEIYINKSTGEFSAKVLVDNLSIAIANPDWMGNTGENKGKYMELKGILPINDVINNNNSVMNQTIELTAGFNDIEYPTQFTFSILRMSANNGMGFSIMAKGSVSISRLEINNLKQLDDELGISLSFTGR
jgi:hypothetical protein